MALWTITIDPKTPQLRQAIINKHYERKHGKNAYYGQQ
jgi:L-ribulose-5-phosphate 4-epimerase